MLLRVEHLGTRGYKAQYHGLPSHCRRKAILSLALSYFQPDKASRRLVGRRCVLTPEIVPEPSQKHQICRGV
jgi:hypothetical protein